ncbi:MAG TPA: SpoIIE family protein phosphatase [Kofleriaceae bacterium]|nr:SpoIIE family protein phosphatase [Kofleriaceae bacterium]
MKPRPPSRARQLLGRLGDRLGRSSHVFLLVLLVLCGIEVMVDWNATLTEINVLRGQLRQKGENYADLLRKASENALLAYDWDELERLSQGVFEDDDVVYVRFSDLVGNTLYDRLRPEFGSAFEAHRNESFRDHYRRQMARDARGMVVDPLALRQKMERSRYVDFVQRFNDWQDSLVRRFSSTPRVVHAPPPRALYQDRLADERGERDTDLTYALGAITAASGDSYGVVLIAFSNAQLKRATFAKYMKGLAITLFFVALILVQNIFSRRAKLRLLDLEAALSAARAAIRGALPETAPAFDEGRLRLGVAFAQADRVGGTVYDLRVRDPRTVEVLVAVPEGSGVEAAFASVVLRDLYRRVGDSPTALAQAAALLAAYDASPLGRPVELLLMRLSADGTVDGVTAGLDPPSVISSGTVTALALGEPLEVASRRLAAPLRPFATRLDGAALALYDDGLPAAAPRRLPIAAALEHLAAGVEQTDPQALAEALVAEAVKRYKKKQTDDLFALVLAPRV